MENNALHRLLKRSVHAHELPRKLPEMLELVDQRIRPSLFLERSTEHPGSLTPLALWISAARGPRSTHHASIQSRRGA